MVARQTFCFIIGLYKKDELEPALENWMKKIEHDW
ncbi:hypothetical protein LMOSLCC2376_0796 [Listeria monocytogenes SLCC2376]|nr:hypothetical protein LMOSLCC2376_0796 [Listeria monocytogenes SLCC2376]